MGPNTSSVTSRVTLHNRIENLILKLVTNDEMISLPISLTEMKNFNWCEKKSPRDIFQEGGKKRWNISSYEARRRKIVTNDQNERAGKKGRKSENESDQSIWIRASPYKCEGLKQSDRRHQQQLGKVDSSGNNLLHLAFLHDDTTVEDVKFILRRKKVLAITINKRGRLPLHYAIESLYRNKDAFGGHAYEIIDILCKVEPRMVSFKDRHWKDALDLAHKARTRSSHLGWLYDYLLQTKIAIYRKQKRFWEEHGFVKVLPPQESDNSSVSSPSSLSCCPSFTLTEAGGWAIDTRGVYV